MCVSGCCCGRYQLFNPLALIVAAPAHFRLSFILCLVCLFICVSVCLAVSPLSLSVCLSPRQPVCLPLSLYVSVSVSVSFSIMGFPGFKQKYTPGGKQKTSDIFSSKRGCVLGLFRRHAQSLAEKEKAHRWRWFLLLFVCFVVVFGCCLFGVFFLVKLFYLLIY